jgi:uncharacterized membrane protein YgdD (TMEM256/DUF423 family)
MSNSAVTNAQAEIQNPLFANNDWWGACLGSLLFSGSDLTILTTLAVLTLLAAYPAFGGILLIE